MAIFRNPGRTGPVEDRIFHFFGTSPDDAHNRRRLIFFLIVFFLPCIVFELAHKDENTVQLIKDFTSTIVWLIGIYVGGSVAAKVAGEPQSSGGIVGDDLGGKPPTNQNANHPSANSDIGKNPQAGDVNPGGIQ
jgi:hypothetical protein